MCLLARPDHLRRELTKSGTSPPKPKKDSRRAVTPWATRLGRFTLCRPKKKRPGGRWYEQVAGSWGLKWQKESPTVTE